MIRQDIPLLNKSAYKINNSIEFSFLEKKINNDVNILDWWGEPENIWNNTENDII